MSREITKEEEAVIEAASALASWGAYATMAHGSKLVEAVRAMNAARALKKPMSAEERAKTIWLDFMKMPLAFADDAHDQVARLCAEQIRLAESAAWDRCVEAAEALWVFGGLYVEIRQRTKDLRGQCHEASP